jgi:hypothetical protein
MADASKAMLATCPHLYSEAEAAAAATVAAGAGGGAGAGAAAAPPRGCRESVRPWLFRRVFGGGEASDVAILDRYWHFLVRACVCVCAAVWLCGGCVDRSGSVMGVLGVRVRAVWATQRALRVPSWT